MVALKLAYNEPVLLHGGASNGRVRRTLHVLMSRLNVRQDSFPAGSSTKLAVVCFFIYFVICNIKIYSV